MGPVKMQGALSSADASFDAKVQSQVIQPIIDSITFTSSTSDPAPIASACTLLISTLYLYNHQITLHTLLQAVTELHNLSQDVMLDAHTTTSLDWQTNSSRPQAIQLLPFLAAPDKIAKYKSGMKTTWTSFVKLLTWIMGAMWSNDDDLLEDNIKILVCRIGMR
ncbi:hypothetical protein NDA16_000811 [Ustilago loliicola]|nr:hypothetical protein NDA16_000811 [Ustilago loliicola]